MPWGWNLFGRAGQGVKQDPEVRAYMLPYLDHVLGQYAVLPAGPSDARAGTFRKRLDEITWTYMITPVRERIRSQISSRISVCLLATAFGGTIYGVIAQSYCPVAFSWLAPLAAFMGAAGAFVSLQQRIQSVPTSGDPIFNIFALKEGKASIYLSPISGALFAILVYLMFVGGYFKGELFPSFPEDPPRAAAAAGKAEHSKTMSRYLSHMDPLHATDLAKLLIWCFIAGFAERLIPDTLNRLIVRKLDGVVTGVDRGGSFRDLVKQTVEQVTKEAGDAPRDATHQTEGVDTATAAEASSDVREGAARRIEQAGAHVAGQESQPPPSAPAPESPPAAPPPAGSPAGKQ